MFEGLKAPFFMRQYFVHFISSSGNLIQMGCVIVSIDDLNFLRGRITYSGFNRGLPEKRQEESERTLSAFLQLLYEDVHPLRKG